MSTMTADTELKAKHRAMWASGDYPTLAAELIAGLGPILVDAAGIRPGQRVLDVAAGSGNVAIPAALAGADVTASDLTPELFDAGRAAAARHAATVDWQSADVEALPYDDAAFDTVVSCVGVMFAPNHQAGADEMLRVCRPGGRIGLINWTPSGFIGQMFATMKPFVAPPPPGAQPPPLWGDEAHLHELFGDRLTDVTTHRQSVRIDHFAGPEEFRDYFKSHYGPTIAAYRYIAAEPDRVAELDRALADLAREHALDAERFTLEWEYLLMVATRAG